MKITSERLTMTAENCRVTEETVMCVIKLMLPGCDNLSGKRTRTVQSARKACADSVQVRSCANCLSAMCRKGCRIGLNADAVTGWSKDPGPPSGGEVPLPCAEQQFRVQLMDSAPVEPLSTAFSISCYGCKSMKQTCKMTVRALNTKGSVRFRLCGEDWGEGSMVRFHVICSA